MNSTVDRFKKRKAILERMHIPTKPFEHTQATVCMETTIHSSLAITFKDNSALISTEAETLLAEIHGKLDEEKMSALIEACQKECLQAVIRPFGLAKVLFEDKDGGNVDTVHNVRSGVFATQEEQKIYLEREKYGSKDENGKPITDYHKDPRYIAENAISSAAQKNGQLMDAYGNVVISIKDQKNQDHVVSAKEIQDDPGRILAELNGVDLASQPSNLQATTATINNAKKQKKMDEYLLWLENTKIPTLKNDIERIEIKSFPTQEDLVKLQKYKADLKKFDAIDKDKMRAADKAARKEIDGAINTKYYQSGKFIKNTAATSLKEGSEMGVQQAIGVLMEEFVRAAFFEVKDAWQNGFKGSIDDSFLDALKGRFMRVAERIQNKWKDAACAFRDGFISGFLSNIITVIINTFATMSARVVRIAREGFMSLYHALKMLAFPPEDMSLAQAADAASKLLAAGLITGGGILLEASFETSLKALGALAPYISSIAVGLATGLCTVFAVYLLDQLDIFGVKAESRHGQVVAKLDGIISDSYERAMDAASVFDGPALIHLT
jgi:hypothetical protein